MNLYFIAIIPDEGLRAEVKSLKEEIRDRFGARHALKSPAHITLVPPFKRKGDQEIFIIDFLSRFASHQESFSLILKGFGCFSPRVIYIDVEDPDPVRKLYALMCDGFEDEYLLTKEERGTKIRPHMTIATRDLDKEHFYQAWPEYKNRHMNAKFDVKSVFLLKHNGKFWDIYKEFEFGK